MKWQTRNRLMLTSAFLLSSGLSTLAYSEITYNGFISAGGGFLIDDDEIASYEGFDGDWSTDPDTTFGFQVTADISDKVTATGQFLAQGNNEYNVEAEWAYIAYAATDNLNVRVGRLRSPFFFYSDFLDVGYAYPWIRPPEQVYRFLFSTVEGVDAIYTSYIGDWDSSIQAYYGRLSDSTNFGGESIDLNLQSFMGANWTLSNDWLSLRATWNQADVDAGTPSVLQPLLDNLNAFGFGVVADSLEVQGEDGAFWGVGANIDYNDWLVTAEYTETLLGEQSLFGSDSGWYTMLGRRFGEFTYHITYQTHETDTDFSIVDPIPAGISPALDGLRAIVTGIISDSETEVISVGLRYDFAPSTAFKVEWAEIEQNGNNGSLLSFSVDVVF